MVKNKKSLVMGAIVGIAMALGGAVYADEGDPVYTEQPKSDYEVCMDYCMAEPLSTFTRCNNEYNCGLYAKKQK